MNTARIQHTNKKNHIQLLKKKCCHLLGKLLLKRPQEGKCSFSRNIVESCENRDVCIL